MKRLAFEGRSTSAKALLLLALCGSTGLMTGCPGGPDEECPSGAGTLRIHNQAGEAALVAYSDAEGPFPEISVASLASHDEIVPVGTYDVTARGSTSTRTLLQQMVEVKCEETTEVTIQPTPRYSLSVAVSGTGSGRVTSTPAGIDCATGTCEMTVDEGTQVTLEAAASSGSRFTGWGGNAGCTGTAACVVDVTQARSVTAEFAEVRLSAPLITEIEQGEMAEGQVQAQGTGFYIATQGVFPTRDGSTPANEPMLGQITMFAGNFAPRGWMPCDGRLLPINQNQALFALLGTMYGGNGQTTFALPDLRARAPMGVGGLDPAEVPPAATGTSLVPGITSIGLGEVAQGQIEVLGIGMYVALNGIYPPRDGGSAAQGTYYGEVILFAGNFTPSGYAPADGRVLSITSNVALFSLLGTMYGGNGQTTFALPNLRARVPMGAGLNGGTQPVQTPDQIPLVSLLGFGEVAQGQVGVTGLTFAIANSGIYPSPSSGGGMHGFYGQIKMFAGNFAPGGWLTATGGVLPIFENDVLFSLIGTIYGGDGQVTFELPNFAARVPMGVGSR